MTRRPLGRLLRFYFKAPKPIALAGIGAMTAVGMQLIYPLLIGRVVDQAIRGSRPDLLLPLVGLILLTAVIKGIGVATRKRFAGIAAIGAEARLRHQLYEHLQGLDIAYHEEVPTGQLMSRASSDLQACRDFLSMIPISSGMSILLVSISVILFGKDPALAAVTLAGFPLMAYAAARLTAKLHPIVYLTQQYLGELTETVEETVGGIRVVKAFGREELQVGKLQEDAENVMEQATAQIRIRAILLPLFELFPALGLALVLWFGGIRVVNGAITPGDFVAFFVYVTHLQWPVRMIGWVASDSQKASTSSSRIFEVLDRRPGIEDRPNSGPIRIERGEIRFEEVSYRFPTGRKVVDSFDLTIPSGGSVAFVGPTGCGKTTLLKLVLRFLEPTEGRVLIDNEDIGTVTLESLRNQIGTVFEESFLFSDSIRGNIAFGRPDAAEDEIVTAAVLAQAHGFISDLRDGYETTVGEQGYTLSGGQRQRIAIARAILMDPSILLLDDATSAVDPSVEAEIRRGLSEAMKGRTTLIVARRPGSAALADQVVYMENGRIVDSGTHDALWDRLPSYRETLVGFAEVPAGALDQLGAVRRPSL